MQQHTFLHSELPSDLEEDNGEEEEEGEEREEIYPSRKRSQQIKEFVMVSPLHEREEENEAEEDNSDKKYMQREREDEEEEGVEPHGMCGILTFRPYSNFVLLALTLCYGSSVFCRYLISVTSKEMQEDQGWGNAQGTGIEYDLLFGPIFVGVGSVSVLILALLVELGSRKWGIMICLIGWCAVTFVTSFTTVYWQLLLLRIAIAVFTACTPLVLSLLVDYFPEDLRGTALSIYNFALYIGYSCALGLGALLAEQYGWRKAFQFAAASGFPAVICLFFVREKQEKTIVNSNGGGKNKKWPKIIPFEDVNKNKQVERFISLVDRKNITRCCRTYKNCFLGSECVDVIVRLGISDSSLSQSKQSMKSTRAQAVKWGNVLFKRNYFRHVTGDYALVDGDYLYRFRPRRAEEEEEPEQDVRVDVLIDDEVLKFLYNCIFSPSTVPVGTNNNNNTNNASSLPTQSRSNYNNNVFRHKGGVVSGKYLVDALCKCVSVRFDLGVRLGEELFKLGYLESVSQTCFISSSTAFYSLVEPQNVSKKRADNEKQERKSSNKPSFFTGLVYFAQDKILWSLFIAGGLRWGAGFIWAQYTDVYYATEFPLADRSHWLGWIPTAGGLLGVGAGGLIGDRAVVKHGIWARTAVISISCFFSIPFQLGALYCDVPLAFLMLLPMYMCSEMWIGLCLACVLEVCPRDLRTIGISVYLFIVNNIGGLLNMCVEPLGNLLANNPNLKLKYALSILFPGMFLTSGMLFLCVSIALRRRTAFAFAEEKQKLLRKASSHTT